MATCENMNGKIIIIIIWFKNLIPPPFLPDDNLKLRQELPITCNYFLPIFEYSSFFRGCFFLSCFEGIFFSSCVLETYDQVRFSDTMPFFHKKRVEMSVLWRERLIRSFEMYTLNMFVNISDTTPKKII